MLEVHQEREAQRPVVHILTGLVLSGLHANTVGVFARPGHLCQVHQVAGAGGHTLLHKVEGGVSSRKVLAGIVVVAIDTPGEIRLVAIGE